MLVFTENRAISILGTERKEEQASVLMNKTCRMAQPTSHQSGFMPCCSFFAVLCIVFLCIPASIFAAGAQEKDPIATATQYIIEKDYDKAILVLSQVIASNGARMDEAEALMQKIRSIRGNYNDLFQELITTLLNEPENFDKSYEIIERMTKIDTTPNEKSRAIIEKARKTAKLQVERSRKNRIMNEALALIQKQEYLAAIAKYETGFGLQKSDFETGGQSDAFKTAFFALVDQLALENRQAAGFDPPVLAGIAAWKQTAATQATTPATYTAGLRAFLPAYRAMYNQLRNYETIASQVLDARLAGEQALPQNDTNEYLFFVQDLTIGPEKRPDAEGILNAYRFRLADSLTALSEPVRARMETQAQLLAELLKTEDYAAAAGQLQTMAAWYPLWYELAFSANLNLVPAVFGEASFGQVHQQVLENTAKFWLRDQHDKALAFYLEQWLQKPILAADAATSMDLLAKFYEAVALLYARSDVAYTDWTAQKNLTAAVPSSKLEAASLDARLLAMRDKLKVELVAQARNAVRTMAGIQTTSAGTVVTAARTDIQNSVILVRGQDGNVLANVERFPDQAIVAFDKQIRNLNEANVNLEQNIARNNAVFKELTGDTVLVANTTQSKQLQAEIKQLLETALATRKEAEVNIARARQKLVEAESAVALTRAAIKQQSVADAESQFKKARTAYFDSLELQENSAQRQIADKIIAELNLAIVDLKTVIAITKINKLLAEAQTLYTREQYNVALTVVVDAEEVWNTVRPGEINPAIDILKQRITIANTLTRDRFYTEADPAYNTLANYMNLALVDFEAARAIKRSGSKAEFNVRLDSADRNLNNILLIKPNNWDARILQLKILELQNDDPQAFRTIFGNRVSDAKKRLDAGADRAQILTELEALSFINPDYPGLKSMIVALEIALGKRENPVTVANRNRAVALVAQARPLSISRDGATLERALALLNQAIVLDPNNGDAKFMADQVRIRQGFTTSVVLSIGDEQEYQRALRLYNAGSDGEAYAIVLRLLGKGNNSRYPPLKDLEAKLKRRLGIA